MAAHWSIKMLFCFGNLGEDSLEAILLNLRISSQVSQVERPKELSEMEEGISNAHTFSLWILGRFYALSPSPAVLVVSP